MHSCIYNPLTGCSCKAFSTKFSYLKDHHGLQLESKDLQKIDLQNYVFFKFWPKHLGTNLHWQPYPHH
jgi:hypothetical protein